MPLVTPQLAACVFIVIIVAAILIAWYMGNHQTYDQGSFHVFIAVLVGLSVFVTMLFYLSLVSIQILQQNLFVIAETRATSEKIFTKLLDSINSASVDIPYFVASLLPLGDNKCDKVDKKCVKNSTLIRSLSLKIFDCLQQVIICDYFLDFDDNIPTIVYFLQYTNSKILFKQWKCLKINFNVKTQKFGDLLFEYSLQIKNQCREEYVLKAGELFNDTRYQELLKN